VKGREVPVVIAIDGPGGAGKSTIARVLAERLGVAHVDTGAMYRAVTLAVLRAGAEPSDAAACTRIAGAVAVERVHGRTLLDGEDVEAEIRGPDVTAVVSVVSGHQGVRDVLLAVQRAGLGERGGVVEGRDAGTRVVPDADLKVWLTATPQERAARRAAQVGEEDARGIAALAEELAARDASDAARMRPAADAVVVDTSGLTVDEVVDGVISSLKAEATP
jgi:cytidylate kinase